MNKEYYSVRRIGDDEEAYLAHANGFKYLSKKWVNGAWRYIYDVTGLGARDRRDAANVNLRAQQQANRSRRQSGATYGIQTLRSARNKANAAQKAYDNTLAGRAEKAFKGASKAVSRTVGSAQKALSNLTSKASKAVNSYKAQQNSKRIAKKVSKKNAEFKKQQLEKIQKAKEGHKYKSHYEKSREKALDSRRLANRYSYSAGAQHMYARDMQRAKDELNFERRKPKREQYMKNWRKNNLQNSKTRSVQGTEGSRIKPKEASKSAANVATQQTVGGRVSTKAVKPVVKPKIQKREGNVSREYWEELIYNRKKNRYR